MPVKIGWYVENQVIHLVPSGEMQPGTIRESMEKVAAMLEASDAMLVHTLVDVRQVDNSIMRLKERAEAVRPVLSHPRCGWVVMVGQTNPIANFISSASAQLFKTRFRSFKTLDEGLDFLKEMVPSLADMPADATAATGSAS